MLQIDSLIRRYGDRVALEGVSFFVRPGEIVGLLGANGAGKSTLLRTAAGLQPPDSGHVRIAGNDVWSEPLAAKRVLGYAAEEPSFHDELSAREYLAFVAAVRGLEPAAAETRTLALARALELTPRLDEPVRAYSHGMRKKLSFLAAVLHGEGDHQQRVTGIGSYTLATQGPVGLLGLERFDLEGEGSAAGGRS